LALSGSPDAAFAKYRDEGQLTHINWSTFLLRTELTHQDFLAEARRQQRHVAGHP